MLVESIESHFDNIELLVEAFKALTGIASTSAERATEVCEAGGVSLSDVARMFMGAYTGTRAYGLTGVLWQTVDPPQRALACMTMCAAYGGDQRDGSVFREQGGANRCRRNA